MGNELAKRDPRDIEIAGFTLSAVGVAVTGKPTLDEWQGAMQFVARAQSGVMWWHGDLLNYGYATYGEMASQEDGDGKYSSNTLYKAKSVSKHVPTFIRIKTLTWEHHAMVAALYREEEEDCQTEESVAAQKEWLERAVENKWTVSQMRKEMADERARKTLGENPLPDGKYHLLYADPPWRYDFAVSTGKDKTDNRKGREIEKEYPTMDVDMICGMEASRLAGPDSVLFLWATSPKLPEAFRVIEAWGFEYKTCMVWRKDKIGMGYYARQQHELLLIATVGMPPSPPADSRPPSVLDGVRTEHSKKPSIFAEWIEKMYPKAKKVELFCREQREGWDAWGNEAK